MLMDLLGFTAFPSLPTFEIFAAFEPGVAALPDGNGAATVEAGVAESASLSAFFAIGSGSASV